MNPVLLKSGGQAANGNYLCSLLVNGSHVATEEYGSLAERTTSLRQAVSQAHAKLAARVDWIVIEGAGSCTELNLMDRDIVNLPLIRDLDCPWLLVADIDRGGVFAQIIGTQACVSEHDWEMCCGVVVNRLRGDPVYFEPGPRILEERIGKPVFVVPWLYDLNIPEEDGLSTERKVDNEEDDIAGLKASGLSTVVVVAYPYLAIDSDFLPLEQDPRIGVVWCRKTIPSRHPDVIVLPGSRLTRADLEWLHATGWSSWIQKHARDGGRIVGICGGYQMLGRTVHDFAGVEGPVGSTDGLDLIPVTTTIHSTDDKIVSPRAATIAADHHVHIHGFELRCGRTECVEEFNPMLVSSDPNQDQGFVSGNIMGCYMHGLFDTADARRVILDLPKLGDSTLEPENIDPLDRLSDHLETCGLTAEVIGGFFIERGE